MIFQLKYSPPFVEFPAAFT